MSNKPNILVFDSGAGGLSIAQEILALYPDSNLIYAVDNAMFPYGLMDDDHLIQRIIAVIGKLLSQFNPDIAVIACNTASTIALDQLRTTFDTIFVGVVPAIKPAVESSNSGVIGLLATPATVNRQYTDTLVREFAPNCDIIRLGSSKLVGYAEAYILGEDVNSADLELELSPLISQAKGKSMDTIVLACTHFPLLKKCFQKIKSLETIHWVDSGNAIARRVGFHIDKLTLSSHHSAQSSRIVFAYTDPFTQTKTKSAYQLFLDRDNLYQTEHTAIF
ncbi:glutamate racemase [Teredinibacter haidensis]|uniref:glutamate racemase n=1 Tax=Teredinibacter haidensis TaxID=2731755 RepID=UPI00094906C7|nr:glutamate racemase [Teredinibacter haidensis]